MASASTARLSLLLPRRVPSGVGGGGVSGYPTMSSRCYSILPAAAVTSSGRVAARDVNNQRHDALSRHHDSQRVINATSFRGGGYYRDQHRWFSSKCYYASVDHSAAYREAMESSHGTQLRLALEEGRGKDDLPFDPFSQFLDSMGGTSDSLSEDGGAEEFGEGIEEAEYEAIEDHDEDEVEEGVGEEDDNGPIYTNTGAFYRPKSERLALRAGYPAGGKFAVIHLAGFQHKVTFDDLLVVNKLKPVSQWSVGSTHTIKDDDVLLLADKDRTLVGLPGVKGGQVDVMVEEITRDKTLIIFKKRRRKHSRRKNGFRRQVTFLRVLDVRMPGEEGATCSSVQGDDNEARVNMAA